MRTEVYFMGNHVYFVFFFVHSYESSYEVIHQVDTKPK